MKEEQVERRKENRRKRQTLIWSWSDKRKDSNGFVDTTHSLGRRKEWQDNKNGK